MRKGRTRYRLSPINIFVAISAVVLLVSPLILSKGFGGLLMFVYLVPLFIFGLVADYLIQLFSKTFRFVIILELVIIILALMLVLAVKR